jgi:hypothetical protein
LPFLVRRKDVGKYVYWRILERAIARRAARPGAADQDPQTGASSA